MNEQTISESIVPVSSNEETKSETTAPVSEVSTEVSEISETTEYSSIYIADEYEYYSLMYSSFQGFSTQCIEQNEFIISDMNRLAAEIEESQNNHMFVSMLICGLLGILLGICFVNIFTSR